MHITLETDYAIRIVDLLAKTPAHISAVTISGHTGVSHRNALKILRKLVAAELVTSYKGVRGGYELRGKPENISLYDVVVAMEGIYKLSRCLDEDYDCNCSRRGAGLPCAYQNVFSDISEEVKLRLKRHNFSQKSQKE